MTQGTLFRTLLWCAHQPGDGEQTICKIPNEKTVSLMGWHVPRLRRETLAMFLRWVRFSSGPRWSTRWLRVKMMNNVPVMTNGIVWNSNNVRVTKRDLIRKDPYGRIRSESPQLNLLTLWKVKWFRPLDKRFKSSPFHGEEHGFESHTGDKDRSN